jgi:hypothetical protein
MEIFQVVSERGLIEGRKASGSCLGAGNRVGRLGNPILDVGLQGGQGHHETGALENFGLGRWGLLVNGVEVVEEIHRVLNCVFEGFKRFRRHEGSG